MLKKDATQRFFSGLEKISSDVVGTDSDVAVAARAAVDQPSPTAFVRAQEELAQLPEDLRENILTKLHAALRNDLEAIWDNLPNSPKSGRAN